MKIEALRCGQRLTHGLFDEHGRLLLASGTLISDHFLEMLRSRGIRTLRTTANAPSAANFESDAPPPATLDEVAQRFADDGAPPDATAYALTDRARPGKARLDPEAFDAASRDAAAHAERLMSAWDAQGKAWLDAARPSRSGVVSGRALEAGPTAELLHDVLPMIAMDVDLPAIMVNLSRTARQSILAHGVRTALVAMHLAQQIGYPPQRIIDAGLVGMLADLGMARLPETLLTAQRPLTQGEWLEVRRHPAYTADLLEQAGVTKDVRIAIYQHHERLDGSGYPHGRKGFFLHPLARLIAVADTYAALSEPRGHRPAQSAHHAVKAVLLGVKAGSLDPVVGKLLVDTVGLFPVGSRVDVQPRCTDAATTGTSRAANTGHVTIAARVLRSPDDKPDRPILVVLDEAGEPTKTRIDMRIREELTIAKVYAPHEGISRKAVAA